MGRTLSATFIECLERAIHNVGGKLLGIYDAKKCYVVKTTTGKFAYLYNWNIQQFIQSYKGQL